MTQTRDVLKELARLERKLRKTGGQVLDAVRISPAEDLRRRELDQIPGALREIGRQVEAIAQERFPEPSTALETGLGSDK